MAPIRAEKTEQIENKVLAVLRDFKHPLALREIYGMRDLALMHDHPEVAEVQRQAFLRIIEELPSNEQPWNTYGSEAYYMDFMLRDPNESEDLTAKPAGSSYIKGLGTGSVTTQEQDRHRRILHAMSTAIQADQKQRLKEEGR